MEAKQPDRLVGLSFGEGLPHASRETGTPMIGKGGATDDPHFGEPPAEAEDDMADMTREELKAHLDTNEAKVAGMVSNVKAALEKDKADRDRLHGRLDVFQERADARENRLDARLSSFESTISNFETRLESQAELSNERFESVFRSLNERFESVSGDIKTNRWIIGTIIALAVALIAVLDFWGASGG